MAQSEHNPYNTLYDAKRFIGKKFSEKEVQEAQKQYPFKVKKKLFDCYAAVRLIS